MLPSYFGESLLSHKNDESKRISVTVRNRLVRLFYTSVYIGLITPAAAAMPFFVDFVSIFRAVRFTLLDFVFHGLAFLKAGKLPRNRALRLSMHLLNFATATWFSVVAGLGSVGAVRFIVEDIIKTYNFFHDM
ncbi:hypothetical protein SLA2020_163700 [Shorea laevis]